MIDKQIWGNNLRQLRLDLGLCRQEFADKCGLSLYTIRSYQSGAIAPSMPSLMKICETFSVSPNRLLAGQYQYRTEQTDIDFINQNSGLLSSEGKALFQKIYTLLFPQTPLTDADFGMRLRMLREQNNLSKKDFSSKCHISEVTLSAKESSQGLPDLENVLTFCMNLSVSPEYLLCGNLSFYSPSRNPYLYLFPTQIAAFSSLLEYMSHICIK